MTRFWDPTGRPAFGHSQGPQGLRTATGRVPYDFQSARVRRRPSRFAPVAGLPAGAPFVALAVNAAPVLGTSFDARRVMIRAPVVAPVPIKRRARVSGRADATVPVAHDLAHFRDLISNVYFVGPPQADDRGWVMVDTGDPGTVQRVAGAAAARFGPGSRPAAIILTHGHFDHVGTARSLADAWDAPVFAHELELPYLTGRSMYPPSDPTAGGGALAAFSFLFPRHSVDLGARVRALPSDGTVPYLPDWRWIHTPGHAPGHISLFRDADRTLIAGDAFITEPVESLIGVVTQRQQVRGPPRYLTTDWWQARQSVDTLAALGPSAAGTGHGLPLRGDSLMRGLDYLLRTFEQSAVPRGGRYVGRPARADASGTLSYPPPATLLQARPVLVGATATALAVTALLGARRARE